MSVHLSVVAGFCAVEDVAGSVDVDLALRRAILIAMKIDPSRGRES